ncbi:MAG TPA: hypothetical protein VGK20_14840 [Candidatus Binatia bacterium]|jgi:hypothetical protein
MRRPLLELAGALVVFLLTIAVAWPSLQFGFVDDDHAVVLERKPFWEMGLSDFLHSRPYATGRHFLAVTLDLDRLPSGTVPLPFHATNIAIAGLLSVLVLVLALRLGLSAAAASVAAALFAVHPVHVDAVSSIVGRCEALAAIGVVGALLVALGPADPARRRAGPWLILVATALLAGIAMHSNESALCLPLLLVSARLLLGARVALAPALAGTAVAIASWAAIVVPLMPTMAPTDFVDNPLVHMPATERIPKACAILWDYARLLVWPHPLLEDRSFRMTDPSLASGTIAVAAWLLVAWMVWRLARRHRVAAFAIAWFPLAFAVTANIAGTIGVMMAERLLLLPSVGVCLLAGLAFERFASTLRARALATVATVGVVITLFVLFRARQAPWNDPESYFAISAASSPLSAKAQFDYGTWLLHRGEREDAEASFSRALALVPSFAMANSLKAQSMAERGDAGGAAESYLAYIATTPDDTNALKNLASLLMQAGRPREALHWARRLVELLPGDQGAVDVLEAAEGEAKQADANDKPKVAPEAAPPKADAATPSLNP